MSNAAPKLTTPVGRLQSHMVYQWNGQDIRTLPRKKLLEIIGELGGEVKQLREENINLNRIKFYRR